MKNTLRYLFLLLFIFSSCKSDKKSNNSNSTIDSEQIIKKQSELLDSLGLKVVLDLKSNQEGLFQIKFRSPDTSLKPFIEYNTIKEEQINQQAVLEGSYNIEKYDYPSSIQLILGHEKPKEIVVNSIKMMTDQVIIKIDKSNLLDYFSPNKYLEFDSISGILTTKKIDKSHLPILTLKKIAIDSLSF